MPVNRLGHKIYIETLKIRLLQYGRKQSLNKRHEKYIFESRINIADIQRKMISWLIAMC